MTDDETVSNEELAQQSAETLPERNVMSLLTGTSTTGSMLGSPEVLPGTGAGTGAGAPDGGISGAAAGTAGDAGHLANSHLPPDSGTYTPDATSTASS